MRRGPACEANKDQRQSVTHRQHPRGRWDSSTERLTDSTTAQKALRNSQAGADPSSHPFFSAHSHMPGPKLFCQAFGTSAPNGGKTLSSLRGCCASGYLWSFLAWKQDDSSAVTQPSESGSVRSSPSGSRKASRREKGGTMVQVSTKHLDWKA